MDSILTFCMFTFLVIVVLMVLSRLARGFPARASENPVGTDYPQYDDPNIQGRGSFGNEGYGDRPTYDDPTIRSRGSFGTRPNVSVGETKRGWGGGRLGGGGSTRLGGRGVDSPNIRSRGGFGRNK